VVSQRALQGVNRGGQITGGRAKQGVAASSHHGRPGQLVALGARVQLSGQPVRLIEVADGHHGGNGVRVHPHDRGSRIPVARAMVIARRKWTAAASALPAAAR